MPGCVREYGWRYRRHRCGGRLEERPRRARRAGVGRETRKPGLRFDPSTSHSRHRGRGVAESERVGCAGLPEQHTPALPGTAGPRRRSLHPRRLDQSKGRGTSDRRVETPELENHVRRAGHPGPEVGSHRLPSCFRVIRTLQTTDRPGLEHTSCHHRTSRASGPNYRRVAPFRQGPVRPVPRCLDPGRSLCGESIERASSIPRRFAHSYLAPPKRRLHSSTST